MGGAICCQPQNGHQKTQHFRQKSSLNPGQPMVKYMMDRFARIWPPLRHLAALAILLMAAACATVAGKGPSHGAAVPPPSPPPVAVAAPAPPSAPLTDLEKFAAFLRNARVRALGEGIRPDLFDRAVAGIAPIAAIGEANANQPEFVKPVWSYMDGALAARRIANGKKLMAENDATLTRIEAKSGVPKGILVAVWGMETDYGRVMGSYNLFAALATLAYDGPRRNYATPEFFAALHIAQDQGLDPKQMVASWAGAFGQTQFTPTTFLTTAVDGDGDGRIDLWRSPADALASAAQLLARAGWQRGRPWGYEVRLPAGFAFEDADLDVVRPVSEWGARGVTRLDGGPLTGGGHASIYVPAGARGPAFLLLPNFSTILKYNNAASYALAIAYLGERIAGREGIMAAWPRDERPLSLDERIRFQADLIALGYDTGGHDGILGRRTRTALRNWQKAGGHPADGFPTASMLALLDAEAAKKNMATR